MAKAVFILKQRQDYGADPAYWQSYQVATGMWNSSVFCSQELQIAGHESMVEMVVDANDIDRVVTSHNADIVFIEGLWVTPAKFQELLTIPRHRSRRWVVRIHSEIPFLASEGIAIEWISRYLEQGIMVAPNSPRAQDQLKLLAVELDAQENLVPMLPNCYPTNFSPLMGLDTSAKTALDVGCFGAFRLLKNHLQQVFVAKRFADQVGLPLRFHTNNRIDGSGQGPSRNVTAALQSLGVEHVEHAWEDRETFLETLANVDLHLQLSMSETFNIVAADVTLVGRPMLVSDEISWAYPFYGDPQRVDDCVKKLTFIWANKPFFIQKNRGQLAAHATTARQVWRQFARS